jgi:hypothetical protein
MAKIPNRTARSQRLEQTQLLLVNLRKVQRNARHFLLMGDESWFFYYTPHQKLWMPPDVETPEVARRLIETPKLMVTIF